jgi:hypothetical protein
MLTQPRDVGPASWSHGLAAVRWVSVLAARRNSDRVRFQPAEAAWLQALPVHRRVNRLLHAVPVPAKHNRRFALTGHRVLYTLHLFAELTWLACSERALKLRHLINAPKTLQCCQLNIDTTSLRTQIALPFAFLNL